MFYGVQAIKLITSFRSEMNSKYPSAQISDLHLQSPESRGQQAECSTQGARTESEARADCGETPRVM